MSRLKKLMVLCYECLKVRFFPKYQTGISVTDVELGINVVKNRYCDESTCEVVIMCFRLFNRCLIGV